MKKKIDRERAIFNLRIEAEERVIKNEVMRFRLEAQTFKRLLLTAKKLNKPAGTLVREWVIEKLDQLENQPQQNQYKESPQVKAINIIADSLAKKGLLKDDQIGHIHKLLADQSEYLPR